MDRRHVARIAVCVIVYAALLFASEAILRRGVGGPLLYVVALLPMLPAFGLVAANMQRYREMDELEKRIFSEGLVFAFACTAVATFSYGFLEQSAHAPRISYFWVWTAMGVFWFAGWLLARRRYA